MTAAIIMLIPVLVALYTANYAKWAWQRQYRLGAVGLGALAILSVMIPGWVLWFLG